MQAKSVRVAILGGSIHSAVGRAHISALSLIKNIQLVGGCFSRDELKNQESAKQYGLNEQNVYKNIEQMILRRNEYDVAVVLTPTDQHHDQIKKLIEHGINVISEKSLDTSASEAAILRDLAAQYDVFLGVIFNYTGYPMIREFRDLIQSDTLGKLKSIQIEMPQEGYLRKSLDGEPIKPQNWRLQDYEIPTISLDLGVHIHSLIDFLVKIEPISVIATYSSHGNFTNIVDDVRAILKMQNGVDCSIWFSKSALGHRNGLSIAVYGSKASLKWIQTNPEELTLSKDNGEIVRLDQSHPLTKVSKESRYSRFKVGHPAGFVEALANYYEDTIFVLCDDSTEEYRFNREYAYGAKEAISGLILLEAMTLSNSTGKWVSLGS